MRATPPLDRLGFVETGLPGAVGDRQVVTGPDGRYNEDICVMDAAGTHVVNLTPETFENWPSCGPATGEPRRG